MNNVIANTNKELTLEELAAFNASGMFLYKESSDNLRQVMEGLVEEIKERNKIEKERNSVLKMINACIKDTNNKLDNIANVNDSIEKTLFELSSTAYCTELKLGKLTDVIETFNQSNKLGELQKTETVDVCKVPEEIKNIVSKMPNYKRARGGAYTKAYSLIGIKGGSYAKTIAKRLGVERCSTGYAISKSSKKMKELEKAVNAYVSKKGA